MAARPDSAPRLTPVQWTVCAVAGVPDPHAAWRYTVMSGVLPALPLVAIRRVLPESHAWLDRRATARLLGQRPAAVGTGVYLVGFVASWWLPEPPGALARPTNASDTGRRPGGKDQ